MGTLTDITNNASNAIKRRSTSSMRYETLSDVAPGENLGKKPPHFMSPTVSSSKQAIPKSSKSPEHIPTPPSSLKARTNGNWVSSAAKRVGFSKVGEGTPKGKKEGKQSKSVIFPDKLATPSNSTVHVSPHSSTSSSKVDKTVLRDKPLPDPPIAQMGTDSPAKQNRSLIDASEKPLKRSPPGKPWEHEEWPVLFPNRPTTPNTLRNMAAEPGNPVISSTEPAQLKERYPLLPSANYDQLIDMTYKGAENNASAQSVEQKPLTPPKDAKKAGQYHTGKENAKSKATPPRASTASTNQRKGGSPSKSPSRTNMPSTGTTAAEKSPTRATVEPRQTRTSSLRARLSAGQATKDNTASSNNKKLLGLAKSTVAKEASNAKNDVMDLPTPVPPGAYPLSHKPSKESLHGNRRAAPAQFVAGSRRPPSRGSLRSESRASSHSTQGQPPSRPAPPLPTKGQVVAQKKSAAEVKEPEVVPRKSSIPVFRSTVSSVVTQADSKLPPNDFKGPEASANNEARASADFGIFEDKDNAHASSLAAIQESPYKIKRLSVSSPEHGPTLKISPSADRIIMGSTSDKENEPVVKKSKDVGRLLAASDLRHQSNKDRAPLRSSSSRLTSRRPSSSQGLPLSASRTKMMDDDTRAKKVKSADLVSTLGVEHLGRLSAIETPKSSRKSTGTSTRDDPFFDAHSSLDKRLSHNTAFTETDKDSLIKLYNNLPESSSWIEPVQKHLGLTADSDALLTPADVQSVMTQEGTVQEPETTRKPNQLPSIAHGEPGLPQKPSEDRRDTSLKFSEPATSTPQQANPKGGSSPLPPRSSSRTVHPDFISNKSPTSPPGNKENVPEEFTARQNRLGSIGGYATSQIDNTKPTSNRSSVANSMARESNKSHSSVSKGMLSKVSGLFHKRNSDDSVLKTAKKNKQKVSVSGNGSPFPPISEIHPVHRPTLASMRRAAHTNDKALRSPLPDFSNSVGRTPPLQSPMPTEVSTTTTLAMQILESARKERSSPKKERLLELGKIMVDALTQARDAEKAMEEAKQAARKAEVAYAMCKKTCGDVSRMVEEWKDEVSRMG
ncbi:MAG: hypothetical protein Q9191_002905 [Dirinaria sp. TL-2023a]